MADVVDFKKEYKELYGAGAKPVIVDVPGMVFIMVDGRGDPNTSSTYQQAIELLYGLSYAIKMTKKGGSAPGGFYDYRVAPLEGLWDTDEAQFVPGAMDKSRFIFTSMIRQPEFVTPAVFEAAKTALRKKKPQLDLSLARLTIFREGLCAQILHKGPFDDEPATIALLEQFFAHAGYKKDISGARRHHEIYLSDFRKTAGEKLKTILRLPIARQETIA